jgi:hypothetical protein
VSIPRRHCRVTLSGGRTSSSSSSTATIGGGAGGGAGAAAATTEVFFLGRPRGLGNAMIDASNDALAACNNSGYTFSSSLRFFRLDICSFLQWTDYFHFFEI